MHGNLILKLTLLLALSVSSVTVIGCRNQKKDEQPDASIDEHSEAPPITRPDASAKEVACPTPFMSVDTSQCEANVSQSYGLTMGEPAEWGFGAGTRSLWFGRLMCKDGTMPDVMRAGNVGPAPTPSSSAVSDTGMDETLDILDKWLVMCPGSSQPIEVYHNMYRCGSPCPPSNLQLMNGDAFRAYIESQKAWDENDGELAFELASRAYELEPELELTTLWLAILQQRRGALKEALELFIASEALNPHTPFATIQKSDVLIELGREAEALTLLDAILARLPDDDDGRPRVECLKASALHGSDPASARALAAKACAAGEKQCC